MGFVFDVGVGVPVDIAGWAMQLLPAAIAITFARSAEQLSRGGYLAFLIFYPIACVILIFIASIISLLFGYEDQQDFSLYFISRDPIFLTPISSAALAIECLFRVLVARLIVHRLRDGGMSKRWAYLVLIPFIDLIVLIGLLVYPPSRANVEASIVTEPQLEA